MAVTQVIASAKGGRQHRKDPGTVGSFSEWEPQEILMRAAEEGAWGEGWRGGGAPFCLGGGEKGWR